VDCEGPGVASINCPEGGRDSGCQGVEASVLLDSNISEKQAANSWNNGEGGETGLK